MKVEETVLTTLLAAGLLVLLMLPMMENHAVPGDRCECLVMDESQAAATRGGVIAIACGAGDAGDDGTTGEQ